MENSHATFRFIPIAGLIFLTACNSAKRNANFTVAINRYLAKQDGACTVINRQFPVDVPRSALHDVNGIGVKMEALAQAGLVSTSDTMAVVHGMLEPLQGPTPPQPVKRYELTSEGKNYLESMPSVLGQTDVTQFVDHVTSKHCSYGYCGCAARRRSVYASILARDSTLWATAYATACQPTPA